MTPKSMFLLITALILTIINGGCSSKETSQKILEIVTAEQVKAFQDQKVEKRMDIFVPLKEQYAVSSHSKSLETLLESKSNIKPQCYQCKSAEYNLAPEGQKPDPRTVKSSITCAVCHEMTAQEFKLKASPLDTCISCHHNPGEIVPGAKVNHPQKEMFLGYGAIGVPQSPDDKYKAGLTCIECHMPNEAHTFEGLTPAKAIKEHKESICVMCHADQSEEEFAIKVDDMQKTIIETCDQLTENLAADKVKIEEKRSRGIDMKQAQEIYDIIFTNLSFVKSDKSMGVHNFEYTTKILDYSQRRQQELVNLLN